MHDWITFDLTEEEREEFLNRGIRFDSAARLYDVFELSELIKTIQREKYSASESARESANLYLRILLTKTAEQMRFCDVEMGAYHSKLGQLRAEIYSNPGRKYTVSSLAESLNISESYFQHLYKNCFGTSPIADAIMSRMEYAKYLLSSTDYSVKAIADELDYPSDVQFIQQFKRATGYSPLVYRKSKRK